MNVIQLIEELEKVKDKNKEVKFLLSDDEPNLLADVQEDEKHLILFNY